MLRQAIFAAEDDTFEKHPGISIPHIAVTLVKDIIKRKKAGGASTLTQQLARKLFLTDEKTWERKIREALLAIRIEKRYTKREIFTMYANQMYFGHGVYGVEAASRLYFGKSAKDLELGEAAMIAGILQGNVRQSPFVNMEAAVRRRNYTLGRMAEVGYITPAGRRGREEEADRHPRRAVDQRHRSRRISSKTSARSSNSSTARSSSTRTASRFTPASTSSCRKPPTARSTTGCGASTRCAAGASRGVTSSPKGTRSRRSGTRAGTGRCVKDRSSPRS